MISMKTTVRILAATTLAVLLGAAMQSCGKKDKDKDAAAGEEMPVAVAYPAVDSVTLTNIYPGNLEADREVAIMVRVDGVLKNVYAQSGQKVKKGQLLYTIENAKYLDAVQQAKASLATAESNLEYYKRQYAAMQKAYKADAVSEMEVLQAKNNMEQSQASIENAKAALTTAETMLGYCRITAPFDGTLSLLTYDQDSYINGEASPVQLNTIFNDDVLHAYISIDESQYLQLVKNLEHNTFKLDSVLVSFTEQLPHTYYSAINYTAPEVNKSTGTVTLRFNLDNKWGELKSGMYMNVHLPYEVAPKAMVVRDASIGTDQLGKYLYTVNDSNQVVYTHIEVGPLYMDTLRIVTSGITPESRYVTEALLKVKDGMKVKPMAVNRPAGSEANMEKESGK